jgi:hypothetical protein
MRRHRVSADVTVGVLRRWDNFRVDDHSPRTSSFASHNAVSVPLLPTVKTLRDLLRSIAQACRNPSTCDSIRRN